MKSQYEASEATKRTGPGWAAFCVSAGSGKGTYGMADRDV